MRLPEALSAIAAVLLVWVALQSTTAASSPYRDAFLDRWGRLVEREYGPDARRNMARELDRLIQAERVDARKECR